MLASVGHPVRKLVRTAIGPITDRKLKAGEWRTLEQAEVAALYKAAGTAP
jgi:23S rRNA pseudouridine2605 synthase